MPARVVVTHDDPEFLTRVTEALRDVGHDAAAFAAPMLALGALEAAKTVDVLVTRIGFPKGKPNGVSLAHMARHKRPGIRVLFIAREQFKEHAAGLGEFMPPPFSVPGVVDAVGRLLRG